MQVFEVEDSIGHSCASMLPGHMLVFSELNVIKYKLFFKLDLISCRNLLIYLDGDLQKKLILSA
ncbi:MAG: hypothetical protein KKC46_10100 [Proteobacteria bacterium]|nr:hypothetical protein [Pseudomonadota bacterium]